MKAFLSAFQEQEKLVVCCRLLLDLQLRIHLKKYGRVIKLFSP
jgi:hypothetical protein